MLEVLLLSGHRGKLGKEKPQLTWSCSLSEKDGVASGVMWLQNWGELVPVGETGDMEVCFVTVFKQLQKSFPSPIPLS